MQKEIERLFEGISAEILSEDIKKNLAVLIETKVNEKTKEKLDVLDVEFDKRLNEKVTSIEDAAVEYVDTYLVGKLDGFLDNMSEKWLADHTVEVENGIKAELYEKFVSGIKGVLKENQVKEDDIETQTTLKEEKDAIHKKYNDLFETKLALEKEIVGIKAKSKFDELTSKLTASDKEKVKSLSEDFDIEKLDEFAFKIKTLVENISKFDNKKGDEEEHNDEVNKENTDIDGDTFIKEEIKKSPSYNEYGLNYL